jgi:hypothetical protein
LTDEKKFLYLFQCEEYDIVEIIVRGVNGIFQIQYKFNKCSQSTCILQVDTLSQMA